MIKLKAYLNFFVRPKTIEALAAISGLVIVSLYTSYFRITQNFYEVDPGKFYRSAQMTPDELDDVIHRYGIKTVISLRGAPESSGWYKPEIETLKKNGVDFRAYWLSTDAFPNYEELGDLLRDLKYAKRPILIHCKAGADRTGMVAALYTFEVMHETKSKALEQLGFKYWHVKFLNPAMDAFLEKYEGPRWVENYDPCRYPKYNNKDTHCHQILVRQDQ
jgi:protein tyrosine/serine phosphatase